MRTNKKGLKKDEWKGIKKDEKNEWKRTNKKGMKKDE